MRGFARLLGRDRVLDDGNRYPVGTFPIRENQPRRRCRKDGAGSKIESIQFLKIITKNQLDRWWGSQPGDGIVHGVNFLRVNNDLIEKQFTAIPARNGVKGNLAG